MTRLLTAITLLTLSGCAGSLESARAEGAAERRVGAAQASPDRCSGIDSARAWSGFGAKTFGVLGGAAGLSTIVVDDPDAQTALAVSSAGSAAFAAGLVWLTEDRAAAYVRECSAP